MKRLLLIFLHLFILLALTACGAISASPSRLPSPTASPQPSRLPDPGEVKELLVQVVDVENRVPGIVVGMIAADPQERWVIGYGRLSAADKRVPDGDTVYEIASITKLFTGTLLAQAVLTGEVKQDDPISIYLPEGVTAPAYEGKSITLLDLATHTSGLPRDVFDLYTPGQIYAYLSRYELAREPGSRYEYSNFGMGLLGNILVQSAGEEDYDGLVIERILRPLGMDSTRVNLTEEMNDRLAPPHTAGLDPIYLLYAPMLEGAGSLRSTANDLLIFLSANLELTQTDLRPALQLANTPQRPSTGEDRVGLGWQVDAYTGFHWHSGATRGSNSFLAWDPEHKFGIVVLANAAVDMDYVARLVIERMPFRLFEYTPQDLDSCAGRYSLADGSIVTIRVEAKRIFIQMPGEPEYELFASSENHFFLPVSELEITFYGDERGEVDRAVGVLDGVIYEAQKTQ